MKRLLFAAVITFAYVPAPAAESLGDASELARVFVPRDSWEQVVASLAQNVQARLQSHPGSNLHYPPDFSAKVRAEIESALPYDTVVAMNAKEISATYSEAEVKELLAFYRSPVGQKFLKVSPKVTGKVAMEAEQRVNQKMPDIMKRLGKLAQPAGGPATKDSAK
ncbi:MAG TPA: DUF2059 domain-containing protein [Anaeromyxobacteraceae bacterium]|nr:DUF2059 domain-containing protein [Anaeromyxobacteraceae bacterium]